MSELALPKVDQSTILNRDKIVNKLKKIIKSENVLDHNDEIKPYETDALSAYKQKPSGCCIARKYSTSKRNFKILQ